LKSKPLTFCSIFHALSNSENLAFAMATLVVFVTLIAVFHLSIELRLDIEQVDWVLSF